MCAVSSSPATEQQPETCSAEKHIFVASSSTDLALAQDLSAFLCGLAGVRGECWKDEFPLGLLTFEALEQMLQRSVGAVFVASNRNCQKLNNNVMIELGLVAGRMGRSRVAIYTVGDVDLPSDLAGITRIDDKASQEPKGAQRDSAPRTTQGDIPSELQSRLSDWAEALPSMMQGLPPTRVLHGYSGHWRVVLKIDKWHSNPVGENIIAMNSDLLLDIPCQGRGGTGTSFGRMTVHWHADKQQKPYKAIFLLCGRVDDVRCETDGSMAFRSQLLIRQHIIESGVKPVEVDFPDELTPTWVVRWEFRPCTSDPGLMTVNYRTEVPDSWTVGTGIAFREYGVSV
jgi:hypothetical protein